MRMITIAKTEWPQGLQKAADRYRLFGPVQDGDFYNFKALDEDTAVDMDFGNTRLSPKSVIYPQSEVLFEYTLDEDSPDQNMLKEPDTDYSPRAIVGVRPCDAASFPLVKLNFDTPEYQDPYWLKAYEATTFIGLACNTPCSTCFCTSAGFGPFDETGLDALVVDDGDSYHVRSITEKGEAFLDAAGWAAAGEDGDAEKRVGRLKEAAEAAIVSTISTENLRDADTMELYQAPFWEEIAFACINCGTCTFVCPTCWCFDIQDENRGLDGQRMRNWDSCMFPLFTLHGSGHNPRGEKVQRVRQRFMHKLKYYVDKYDRGIQCVGCGRCVRACPVNIDIRKVAEYMNSFAKTDTCAAS